MTDATVTITGNVTHAPELRYATTGAAYCVLAVAVTRRWQNKTTQQLEEHTSHFEVKCWAQMGENVAASIHQGDRVVIIGRLDQRAWETDQGDTRSVVDIVADDVAPSLRWATAALTPADRP
jgi:single-strand DNA-binding protein